MASIFRVRTSLTGFQGGPGVSTMYFLGTNTALPSVRAFWFGLADSLPVGLVAQVEPTVDELDSATGDLVGSSVKTPVAAVVGTAVGFYAAPAGAVVTWLTASVVAGRRLRGRTFLVPLTANVFSADGSLNETTKAGIEGLAQALIFEQSLSMIVWSRPVDAVPATPTAPAVPGRLGSYGLVTGSRVADKAAVLRSRRD